MIEERTEQKEEQKIVLPKEIQKRMMKFFLRTSIPKIKKEKQEKMRLSITDDRSDT